MDDDEMSSEGVIQLLLGDLYASFSKSSRSNLRKKVENICKLVSDGALSDYAKYDHENKSIQISVDASNPQSRAKFSRSIDSWLKITTFSYFPEFRDLYDINENIEDNMEDYED